MLPKRRQKITQSIKGDNLLLLSISSKPALQINNKGDTSRTLSPINLKPSQAAAEETVETAEETEAAETAAAAAAAAAALKRHSVIPLGPQEHAKARHLETTLNPLQLRGDRVFAPPSANKQQKRRHKETLLQHIYSSIYI